MWQKIILFVFTQIISSLATFGAEQEGQNNEQKIVRDLSQSYKALTVQTHQVMTIPPKAKQLKILVVGDAAVGKTLFIKKILNQQVFANEMPTVALGTYTGSKVIDKTQYNITILKLIVVISTFLFNMLDQWMELLFLCLKNSMKVSAKLIFTIGISVR